MANGLLDDVGEAEDASETPFSLFVLSEGTDILSASAGGGDLGTRNEGRFAPDETAYPEQAATEYQ